MLAFGQDFEEHLQRVDYMETKKYHLMPQNVHCLGLVVTRDGEIPKNIHIILEWSKPNFVTEV